MNHRSWTLLQSLTLSLFLLLLVSAASGTKVEKVPLRVKLHTLPTGLPAAFRGNLDTQRSILSKAWDDLKAKVKAHNATYDGVKHDSPDWEKGQQDREALKKEYLDLNDATRTFNQSLRMATADWNWCKLHKPLVPTASIHHVKDGDGQDQDQARWDIYRGEMTEYCQKCHCDPNQNIPAHMAEAPVPANAAVPGQRVSANATVGAGQVRIIGGDGNYYACPADHPYYSPCDGQCYTSEMFSTGRIPCKEVYYQPGN